MRERGVWGEWSSAGVREKGRAEWGGRLALQAPVPGMPASTCIRPPPTHHNPASVSPLYTHTHTHIPPHPPPQPYRPPPNHATHPTTPQRGHIHIQDVGQLRHRDAVRGSHEDLRWQGRQAGTGWPAGRGRWQVRKSGHGAASSGARAAGRPEVQVQRGSAEGGRAGSCTEPGASLEPHSAWRLAT